MAGFAGTDVETPVYFRDDERVLIEMPLRVDHYEVTGAEIAPT